MSVSDLDIFQSSLDGFDEIYQQFQKEAQGLVLLDMHYLQQTSPQAIFSWHHDCEQFPHMILTIVLNLTNTVSSLQVAGYDEVVYEKQTADDLVGFDARGSALAFLSPAIHRSGFAELGTKKIAFFFGLPSKIDSFQNYGKVIKSPLPSIPIFYDKNSHSHRVGCVCGFNYIMIINPQIWDEILSDESEKIKVIFKRENAHNAQIGTIVSKPDNGKVQISTPSLDKTVEMILTVDIDDLTILDACRSSVNRLAKQFIHISQSVDCDGCGRSCHTKCLEKYESFRAATGVGSHTGKIMCPNCSGGSVLQRESRRSLFERYYQKYSVPKSCFTNLE